MTTINGFYLSSSIAGMNVSGSGIDQVKSGDFNGDGFQDFVVGRIHWGDLGRTASPLQVYLGNGKGGFVDLTSTLFSQGTPYVNYVARMLVADVNGDGVSDIFCIESGFDEAPFTGGQNRLFLSDGQGGLVDATTNLPQKIQFNHGASIGDVNGDGKPDFLVNALMSDGNDLELNTGVGRFVSSPSLLPNLNIANPWGNGTVNQTHTYSGLIDLNNDGYSDMILGHWDNEASPKTSQLYLNNNGSFSGVAPIDLPSSGVPAEIVLDVKPIDLNGDDLADLAISVTNGSHNGSYYQTAYVQLLINDGNGKFHDETATRLPQSTTPSSKGTWYKSITVVDLNHDGHPDMVVDDDNVSPKAFMNNGNGAFALLDTFQFGQKVTVADVDNDGMSDLIMSTKNYGNNFEVWVNTMANQHIYHSNFGGESLLGSGGNDLFISSNGNDTFYGNGGFDTVQLHGNFANYAVSRSSTGVINIEDSNGQDGIDTLVGVQRISFVDKELAFDIDGNAGQAYRLYQAAFDRVPDQGGLGYWITEMDSGMGLSQVATGFINSAEFKTLYGNNPSNAEFVTLLYDNVLHRAPDSGGYSYWMEQLSSGMTRENVLIGFSESTENKVALMAFSMDGNMGKDYRLYQAAFDRKPDVSGLDYWYHQLNSGMTLEQVASGFINSVEFKALYGNNSSNAELVTLLYDNVLHRAPDTGGLNYWMNELDHGTSREQVLIGFSESIENQLSLVGIVQTGIEFV
jgi:hypothetical protein